jgi:hypothetical protein
VKDRDRGRDKKTPAKLTGVPKVGKGSLGQHAGLAVDLLGLRVHEDHVATRAGLVILLHEEDLLAAGSREVCFGAHRGVLWQGLCSEELLLLVHVAQSALDVFDCEGQSSLPPLFTMLAKSNHEAADTDEHVHEVS